MATSRMRVANWGSSHCLRARPDWRKSQASRELGESEKGGGGESARRLGTWGGPPWRGGGAILWWEGWGEELGDALIGDGGGFFLGEGGEDFGDGIFGGETVFLAEDIDRAVFDELVWPADADDWCRDVSV